MADETGATETLADSGTQPPAGDAPSQTDSADVQSQPESISLDEAKKLRSENHGLRTRLNKIEKDALAAAEAQQTDQEKALAKARADGAAELRTGLASKVRASSVRAALQAEGCIDPDICAHAREFADLDVNDDLEVPDLAKAIADFRKAHPAQFTKAAAGTGDGGARPDQPAPKARDLTEAITAHYAQPRR